MGDNTAVPRHALGDGPEPEIDHLPGMDLAVLGPTLTLISILCAWLLILNAAAGMGTAAGWAIHAVYLVLLLTQVWLLRYFRPARSAAVLGLIMLFSLIQPVVLGPLSVDASWLLLTGSSSLAYVLPINRRGFVLGTVLALVAMASGLILYGTPDSSALLAMAAAAAWGVALGLRIAFPATVRAETRSLEVARSAWVALRMGNQARATSSAEARAMHDSVLRTLTVISHGSQGITHKELQRMCATSLAVLESTVVPESMTAVVGSSSAATGPDGQVAMVAKSAAPADLAVHVHGQWGDLQVPERVVAAICGAVAEAVSNVASHAEVDSMDLILSAGERSVNVIVSDTGVGFVVAAVDPLRLGIRGSISARMTAVGGSARILSTAGLGTAVILDASW